MMKKDSLKYATLELVDCSNANIRNLLASQERLLTCHQKSYFRKSTMALLVTYGVLVSVFLLWFVGQYPSEVNVLTT